MGGGRVLIDATNQFVTENSKLIIVDLGGRSSSGIVAEHALGARIVKALNSLYIQNFAAGPKQKESGEARHVVFISGDNSAKGEVAPLFSTSGFAVIDLGDLETGGRMQQLGGPLAGLDLFLLG